MRNENLTELIWSHKKKFCSLQAKKQWARCSHYSANHKASSFQAICRLAFFTHGRNSRLRHDSLEACLGRKARNFWQPSRWPVSLRPSANVTIKLFTGKFCVFEQLIHSDSWIACSNTHVVWVHAAYSLLSGAPRHSGETCPKLTGPWKDCSVYDIRDVFLLFVLSHVKPHPSYIPQFWLWNLGMKYPLNPKCRPWMFPAAFERDLLSQC